MGDSSGDSERLRKFVQLAMKLPMDLQMVLCNRASGLSGENIPLAAREAAFKTVVLDYPILM